MLQYLAPSLAQCLVECGLPASSEWFTREHISRWKELDDVWNTYYTSHNGCLKITLRSAKQHSIYGILSLGNHSVQIPVWSVSHWIGLKGALSSSQEIRAGTVGFLCYLGAFISIHPWLCSLPQPSWPPGSLFSEVCFVHHYQPFSSSFQPEYPLVFTWPSFWLGCFRRPKPPERALVSVFVPQENRWSAESDAICWILAKCTPLSSLSHWVCVVKPLY